MQPIFILYGDWIELKILFLLMITIEEAFGLTKIFLRNEKIIRLTKKSHSQNNTVKKITARKRRKL